MTVNHEYHFGINDEIHARPAMPVETPARIIYVANSITSADQDPIELIARVCGMFGIARPNKGALHHNVALCNGSQRYERHGEFYRMSFTTHGQLEGPADLGDLPEDWLDCLLG